MKKRHIRIIAIIGVVGIALGALLPMISAF